MRSADAYATGRQRVGDTGRALGLRWITIAVSRNKLSFTIVTNNALAALGRTIDDRWTLPRTYPMPNFTSLSRPQAAPQASASVSFDADHPASDAPARRLVPHRRPRRDIRRGIRSVGRPHIEDDPRRAVRVRARELDPVGGQRVRAVARDGDLGAARVVLRAADGVGGVGDVRLVKRKDLGCG